MDTPVVNGVAYPVLHVAAEAYRFRILSVGNDRSFNLQLYQAYNPVTLAVGTDPTATEVKMLPAVPPATGTPLPLCTAVNPVTQPSLNLGIVTALLDASGNPVNGTGLPANCWPNYGPSAGIPVRQTMWPADGRFGGVPDPTTAGPPLIQIGSEGGLLPAPVVIPSTPAGYEYNTRSITVLNVSTHGLWLGPAERADVIVDFSAFAGKTLIMYNDAPAPAPGFDSRLDYFTGDGDQTPIGGAPNTLPGYGPNTRTIMKIIVDQPATKTGAFHLSSLQTALPGIFNTSANGAGMVGSAIVPEPTYPVASGGNSSTATYARIQDNIITFTPILPAGGFGPATTFTFDQKTIQELFTLDYGRMNATLGTELPFTSFLTQTTIPLAYIDPATELFYNGETQLWKITHNGVDTHFIHFHLFNVQVVNRMGWDGTVRPPDENELAWKETVRMNPLEDILVALKPMGQTLPFGVPNSIRLLDVTRPLGSTMGFTNVDPFTNTPITVTNQPTNFGGEYVWHCHILGHEENDMMRPMVFLGNNKGDFNVDYQTDIFWRNQATGANAVWLMNGTAWSNTVSLWAVSDTNWQIGGPK